MKPISCSCGAVLIKINGLVEINPILNQDKGLIIKCGKCGALQKVIRIVTIQIKVEPVKID